MPDDTTPTDDADGIVALTERAREIVATIRSKREAGDVSAAVALLDDLEDVVDEAEDLLSSMDVGGLADAVDWEVVPEAFDAKDVVAAMDDDEDAVDLATLRELVDLSEVWTDMDVREVWRNSRQLADEVDDLTGERADRYDGSPLETAGSDEDSFAAGDDDSVAASGDGAPAAVATTAGGGDADHFDPESVENAVQLGVSEAVGEFRESLLETHERLARVRAANADRFPDRRRTDSRNPTAVRTMASSEQTASGRCTYSTVPEETKYSSAPNRRRIYGDRFEATTGDADE